MVIISPRPFLLGVTDLPLVTAKQYFVRTIPNGAPWRLKYFLVNYPRLLAGGGTIQTTPDLRFQAYDADGRAFQVNPILFPMVTTPSGASLNATNPINIDYPGGSNVKLEITGQIIGTGPDTISLTLFGIRGWEGYGK